MSAFSHIALIGCGFAGTSAFFQLVERYPAKAITIFESTGDFGPGYAYRTDECSEYLLNNTTDTMCLTPASRTAFIDWLRAHPDVAGEPDPKGHLPRTLYGKFLQDVFASTKAAAENKGINVNLIPAEATEVSETDDGQVAIGSSNGAVVADAAILTTGRCPDLDRYQHPPEGSATKYIATHIDAPEMDSIGNDAVVHILGASLSAYDVINRLYSTATGCRFTRSPDGTLRFEPGPNHRRVVLCSRSGRLKFMQSQTPTRLARTRLTADSLIASSKHNKLTLLDVKQRVQDEAAAHGAGIDWDTVMDPYGSCRTQNDVTSRAEALLVEGISAATGEKNFLVDLLADAQFDLWDAFAHQVLAADEELTYRTKIETAALAYAAPCPVPTAERLLALLRAGRLSVVKGVRETRYLEDEDRYAIAHDFGTEYASVLVNATGATIRDVTSPGQPELIRTLASEGVLQQHERDGIQMPGAAVDMTTFRATGANNIYIANMLLWGPGLMASSALIMSMVVERIVDSLLACIDKNATR